MDFMLKDDVNENASMEMVLGNTYAQTADGEQFYPKSNNGSEYSIKMAGLIKKDGNPVYPLLNNGRPNYRVENGAEVYEKVDGKELMGIGVDGKPHYAVNEQGDEYFPECNSLASVINQLPCYPNKSNGDHVFPVDANGNEYYLTLVDLSKPDLIPNRYALSSVGDEIYPVRSTSENNESQYIIGNEYAKDQYKIPYYPKDGFKNEYYRKPDSADNLEYRNMRTINRILLKKYALTNDGKIIVPQIGNYSVIDSKKEPKITQQNIIGKLIRDDNKVLDYLTDVFDDRFKSLYAKSYSYKTLATDETKLVSPRQCFTTVNVLGILNTSSIPFYQRWYFWVFFIAILIIKAVLIWTFFFKTKLIR